jgi:HAD superfamily phosphatase (TIGR01668 family)
MPLLDLLTPHHCVSSVLELTPAWLRGAGVSGLLVDLDCTLLEDKASSCSKETVAWLRSLRAAGLRLCIVSNSGRRRVAPIATHLDVRLPFVCGARKPMTGGLRAGLAALGLPTSAAVVVGDQVFTDVLGGRLLGIRTILVRAVGLDRSSDTGEGWLTRCKRPFERLLLPTVAGPHRPEAAKMASSRRR